MALSSFLKKNSLLRLALPLIAGIVIGWYCSIDMLQISLLALFSISAMLLGISRNAPMWLFGAGASLFMLSVGVFAEECKEREMSVQWSTEKMTYNAQLLDEPVVRGSTVKVLADLSLNDSIPSGARSRGAVYLYIPRSVEAEQLGIGSKVTLNASISQFRNAGNPAEFDIEKFHYIKGITGFAYVGREEWNYEGLGKLTLQMRALQLRNHIVSMYKALSFESDELALLSALTVGERDDFPIELKENYSVAGASHILALSGMHLGVFYLLLATLLSFGGSSRIAVAIRELIIVVLLWGFAFVAGLSPSVVRAAVLFTLVSLGRCLHQDASAFSSLSFAAIVMLVLSPHLLFDISFQLSFAAVFSILLLAPPLQRMLGLERCGWLCRYVANLLILSVVSQIGTLPFVWYYFGVFPLYFLLTNIVVVPLAFLLLSFSVMVWMLSLLPLLQSPFVMLLKFIVGFMNGSVALIASLPGASLSLPSIGIAGACCTTLLLILISYSIVNRRRWLMAFSFCCALSSFVILSIGQEEGTEGDYIIIYNNKKNPLLHVVAEDKNNYLVSTVPQLDAEYEYSSFPYLKREKLVEPLWVSGEYSDSLLSLSDGLLQLGGLSVRLVNSDAWQENVYVCPTDIVLLCRGFLGKIEELVEAYPSSCLLLDASLYKRSRERILRECAALDIEAVDISEVGALMILPSEDRFALLPMRGK